MGAEVKEDEMGRAFVTYGLEKQYMWGLGGEI
jgi:hypothetical protein